MRCMVFAVLWTLAALLWTDGLAAQEQVEFLPSPAKSLSATQRLLDAVALRALLPLGYCTPAAQSRPCARYKVCQRRGR